MFAQMKSRSYRSSKPCLCGGICECHKPSKEKLFPWIIPFAFPILFPGLLLVPLLFINTPTIQHIRVNGQDCIVHYVSDHCTSTGACSGYDEAVCP